MALRYVFWALPYLNSVTSVSHFWFFFSVLNYLFNRFSAMLRCRFYIPLAFFASDRL